ncbi:unnamed protein product, partial [Diabrotica balteata]
MISSMIKLKSTGLNESSCLISLPISLGSVSCPSILSSIFMFSIVLIIFRGASLLYRRWITSLSL